MSDELNKLKKQVLVLKEKLKKKNDAIKKVNTKLSELNASLKNYGLNQHINFLQFRILYKLTGHIDEHLYNVRYEYEGQAYMESDVKSYGARWLDKCIALHLTRKLAYIIWPHEIKIISAKKLY